MGQYGWKCFSLKYSINYKKKSMANIQQLVKRVPQGVTNVSPITAVRVLQAKWGGVHPV